MKTQKVGIFEHEDRKASTQYYPAPGAGMGGRVVIGFFFDPADGRFIEVDRLHGGQYNIVCNSYLWEHPALIPGFLSKKKVRVVRYISSVLFNFNRNAEGLCKRYRG